MADGVTGNRGWRASRAQPASHLSPGKPQTEREQQVVELRHALSGLGSA